MGRPLEIAVIGAGHRGQNVYGSYLLTMGDRVQVVAVAEPDREKRNRMAKDHSIKEGMCFSSYEQLLTEKRLADAVIIATPDHLHYKPALKALKKDYHILLEKPISADLKENLSLQQIAKKSSGLVLVAHVLRYTDFFQRIKEILQGQVLGLLQYINYVEEIGYYHFAHSYVRGHWRNEEIAAPIMLAKSCHDLDMIYYLTGKKAMTISSQGSLKYFHRGFQPEGASDRCLDCKYVDTCIYSALSIYTKGGEWPTSTITSATTKDGIKGALQNGPYGRCVFACDNSVPETQTLDMLLEGGIQVQFALTAFSKDITRRVIFRGTHGELLCNLLEGVLIINTFNGETRKEELPKGGDFHGGGDPKLIEHFINLCNGEGDGGTTSYLHDALESHMIAFAAEEARKKKKLIHLQAWKKENQVLLNS